MIIEESNILKNKLKEIISDKNFEAKFEEIDVNDNKPFTISDEDYKIKEGIQMLINLEKVVQQ